MTVGGHGRGGLVRAGVASALLAAMAPVPALAQQATWAVVPVSVAEAPTRALSVAEHAAATLETSGASVLQGPTLAHRIENALSLPYEAADITRIAQRLREREDPLLVAAASGDSARVIHEAEALTREAEPAALTLHRDAQASADLANICGYWVRAALEGAGGEATARDVARGCLRLVPGWEPSEQRHPPQVRQLVVAVREQLGAAIVVRGSRDDAPGCRVRVNGRAIGETPLARVHVPSGAYAVQLECGETPGRVRRVEVESGAAEVVVRGSLDAALRSEPVALVYAAPSAMRTLAGDVAQLGRATGATRVLAVVEQGSGVVLRAFDVPEGDAPGVQLRETVLDRPGDEATIRQSVAQVTNGSGGAASEEVSPIGPVVLGFSGAMLVAAAILGGVVLAQDEGLVAMCGDGRCPGSARSQADDIARLALTADILMLGGGALAITGLVLTLVLRETRASAAAWCAPEGCGVQLGARF